MINRSSEPRKILDATLFFDVDIDLGRVLWCEPHHVLHGYVNTCWIKTPFCEMSRFDSRQQFDAQLARRHLSTLMRAPSWRQ